MINVRVENLGVIKEANFSLRPLTVFIGENNTNKSWLAYSVFGVFSQKLRFSLAKMFLERKENVPINEVIFSIVEDVTSVGYKEIKDFPGFLRENLNLLLESASSLFCHTVPQFFSVEKKVFENFSMQVSVSNEMIENICSEFLSLPNEFVLHGFNDDKNNFSVSFFKSGENLIIESRKNKDFPSSLLKLVVTKELVDFIIRRIFDESIVLPAERKGSTLIEENMTNLNSLVVDFLKKTEELPEEVLGVFSRTILRNRIISNEIIESFISFMEKAKKLKGFPDSVYAQFAKRFSSVLGGKISVSEEDQLYFVPSGKQLRLPFHLASSLVKSLIPLQLYLEKIASGHDLLVMDEPEMNLHPKAQLELLEVLVSIANGLRESDRNCVLITTHTPYFLEYLEVMLEAFRMVSEKPNLEKEISSKFKVGGKSVMLPPEKLSVYRFTPDGKIFSAFDRENLIIDLKTFANISSLIHGKLWEIEELAVKG